MKTLHALSFIGKFLFWSGLFATPVLAQGGAATLGAQYNVPPGNSSIMTQQCTPGGNFVSANACITIPAGQQIVGYVGSYSVKFPNIEILALIQCNNGMVIWQAENIGGPVMKPIVSPPGLPYAGLQPTQCWVEYQAGNSSGANPPGPAWEIQFTLFYAPPANVPQ